MLEPIHSRSRGVGTAQRFSGLGFNLSDLLHIYTDLGVGVGVRGGVGGIAGGANLTFLAVRGRYKLLQYSVPPPY